MSILCMKCNDKCILTWKKCFLKTLKQVNIGLVNGYISVNAYFSGLEAMLNN
jgi:hypothetical protein